MAQFDWLKRTDFGFHCPEGGFHLDPRRGTRRAVISHAHADHYPRFMGEVYAHQATLDLAEARYQNVAGHTRHAKAFGEHFSLGPIDISFLPAGHMLGSAQILLHHTKRKETILYSGDFALAANGSCTPLSYPEVPVDLVICESTFGLKDLHTAPEESLKEILEASSLPLLIAVYAMGKAQRVNQLLQQQVPEIPVLVDRTILPFHRVYEAHGINLGEYQVYRRQATKKGRYIHLIPPKSMSGYNKDIRHYKLFASGWDRKDRFSYLQGRLDISDHASGSEIRTYLEKINPKEIWFWHGYPETLIPYFEALGIPAKAV